MNSLLDRPLFCGAHQSGIPEKLLLHRDGRQGGNVQTFEPTMQPCKPVKVGRLHREARVYASVASQTSEERGVHPTWYSCSPPFMLICNGKVADIDI